MALARGAAAQLAEEGKARRFAADWRQLEQRQEKLVRLGDRREWQAVEAELDGMVRALKHDPGLERAIKERGTQLGVAAGPSLARGGRRPRRALRAAAGPRPRVLA